MRPAGFASRCGSAAFDAFSAVFTFSSYMRSHVVASPSAIVCHTNAPAMFSSASTRPNSRCGIERLRGGLRIDEIDAADAQRVGRHAGQRLRRRAAPYDQRDACAALANTRPSR